MAHAPQFLKLVNDAKKKIKETKVADVKRRADAGEKLSSWTCAKTTNGRRDIFPGPFIWAKE